MTASNFDVALKYVLKDEGGNDDDPRDHGGRTSRGITQREYDSWCSLNSRGTGDVWHCTDEDLRTIYHDQYWNPYCDKLPSGIDYLFFDISVNAGRQRAVITFQRALEVAADGMMGQITLDAINSYPDKDELIAKISDQRRNWYRNLKQFPIYGKGWLNRVDHSEQGAKAIALSAHYDKTPAPSEKATKDNSKPNGPTISPETSNGTALGTGGIGAMLQQLSDMITPYKDTIKYAGYVLIAVAFISFGYAAWGMYKRSKVQAAM